MRRLKLLHIRIHLFWFGVQLFYFIWLFIYSIIIALNITHMFLYPHTFLSGRRGFFFFSQLEYHKGINKNRYSIYC